MASIRSMPAPEELEKPARCFRKRSGNRSWRSRALLLGPIERVNRWGRVDPGCHHLDPAGVCPFAHRLPGRSSSAWARRASSYFGALVSGIIALNSPHVPGIILIPFIILASATAGFIYGLIPGALKAYLGANELVSTLMLNVIATRFFEMVLNFQLKPADAGYVASEKFTPNAILPVIVESTQVTIAVFILAIVVLISWLAHPPYAPGLRDTDNRLQPALCGLWRRQFQAHHHAGHGHRRHRGGAWRALHLANGIHRQLILNISFALAFEGVVVALLARLNVLVVPFTGLLYAYLRGRRAVHGARRQCQLRGSYA